MKRAPQKFLPPRQLVIYAITRRMLDETAANINKFSMAVAEHYFQQTALDQRHVKFRWGESLDELCQAERHNSQVLGRYMKGDVKVLPADLEDAWVCAMPAPYRAELERELAARRGYLAVPLPETDGPMPAAATVASMTKDFGELLVASAPTLEDGRINRRDSRQQLQRVVAEGRDLVTSVTALVVQAAAVLEAEPPKDRRGD